MSLDKFVDFETLHDQRRKAIARSLRVISVEELRKLGEEVFHDADEPWREEFFRLLAEKPTPTVHHAVINDGVVLLYCRDKDKGLWYLAGSGKGPLPANGRQMMKEAIERGH